ncbi:MAG: hypothetical protein ACJAWW_002345 [Sulfurimonas sp.]|jgi:hypothetical protein
MQTTLNIIETLALELKMIQLQLQLAQRCAKKTSTPISTVSGVQLHIEHSLSSLNQLITQVDNFKTTAETITSARNRIKENS